MTKEEAKELLLQMADLTTQSGVPLLPKEVRDAIKIVVNGKDVPENVDEAAESYLANKNVGELYKDFVKETFKSGAKWQADQGETFERIISRFRINDSKCCVPSIILPEEKFNLGDKVIVQIRKK